MKKALWILSALLVISVISGCSCKRIETNGTVSENFTNCLLEAEDYICNPDTAVMDTINVAAPILAEMLNGLAPGTTAFINASTAQATITQIKNTGCATIAALNNLIAVLESKEFAKEFTKSRAIVKGFDVQPLYNWQIRKGKNK